MAHFWPHIVILENTGMVIKNTNGNHGSRQRQLLPYTGARWVTSTLSISRWRSAAVEVKLLLPTTGCDDEVGLNR